MNSKVNGLTDVRISSFTIEEISDRVYANGRHQCQIRISVLKVGRNSNWQEVKVPLSALESASLRAVSFSSSLNNNSFLLPNQWTSSPFRNFLYDLGLINHTLSQPQGRWLPADPVREDLDLRNAELARAGFSENNPLFCAECQSDENLVVGLENTGATESLNANNVPDIFDFYVSSSATGTHQLMATMQFEELNDGETVTNIRTLTTNMSDNHGNTFSSSIRLTAIPPVFINNISPVLRTIQDRREDVDKWHVHHQTITLYTWQLPFNLRSVSRDQTGDRTRHFYDLGNTHESNRFLTSGRFFAVGTSRVNARDNMTPSSGCVWSFGYSVTSSNRQICAEVLQVSGCSWTSPMNSGTHDVSLIDNFGTEHRFRISPTDAGRTLTLNRTGI